jgi:hypothetical protein
VTDDLYEIRRALIAESVEKHRDMVGARVEGRYVKLVEGALCAHCNESHELGTIMVVCPKCNDTICHTRCSTGACAPEKE